MTRREHLARLLAQHRVDDDLEAEHLGRMRALLDSPGDVFARDHFAPGHFTASAFVLSADDRELLLVFHGKLHRWLQPGGHVEPGDPTVLDAALREVAEETGLTDVDVVGDGFLDVDVHAIPGFGESPRHEHFDIRVLLRSRARTATAGSDARAVRWFEFSEIASVSDASVMRAVRKLRL